MKNMKFVLLFSVIAIFATKVDNFKIYNEDKTQKVLLRKLQTFQQNETLTVTWNEILADVLVTKITRSEVNTDAHNGGILSKCFSEVLWMFKTYVYDKFWQPSVQYETTTETKVSTTTVATIDDKGLIPPTLNTNHVDVTDDPTYNPKSEVELIVPRYHGKIEEGATTSSTTIEDVNVEVPSGVQRDTRELSKPDQPDDGKETTKECPKGSVQDKNGYCVDSVTSKFILYIPNQCPIGYRRDRLGFCREIW